MNKLPALRLACAAAIYLILFVLASSCGLIHPACYAYAGTFFPLLSSFVYLYVAAYVRGFGAAVFLNVFVLAIALLVGEGNPALVIGLIVLSSLSEAIRRRYGYDTIDGVRLSFVPLAYSFYAYSAHWWTDTAGSLASAVEEMPEGYAAMMEPVIGNIGLLALMLVLTIPVAVLGMRLAEKVLKRQAALLE